MAELTVTKSISLTKEMWVKLDDWAYAHRKNRSAAIAEAIAEKIKSA